MAEWEIPAALEGERVDRALALITGLSRREVNDVLDAGRVRVGRRAVTSRSRKVRAGEHLIVDGDLEPEVVPAPAADPDVDVPVLYQDEAVIVVDKPAGLVVHPGNGNREGTLVHGLLARFPDLAALGDDEKTVDRPGIVHRLDKGTSGLLVVARTPEARRSLIGQLSDRTMGREYLALVFGRVDADGGLIDAPLGRSDADPSRIRVQSGGRPARTRYDVRTRYEEPVPTTLIGCKLETGRTHQIRVHLSSIGHPVVGDERYGGRNKSSWPDLFEPFLPFGRPFLHAAALVFDHPVTHRAVRFEAPVPTDLAGLLSVLG
ncbi:MAG TPA: RluA family pseudouridine synthase [Acidimicrobiales bacterium]|jgi:23S rRNA pseudouridine1911/1915/1917 synthase|nr:RluA family pseudouridine synthase [Acidimicrobiales bacterium]